MKQCFTDLVEGDYVLIRAGKYRGEIGTIMGITAHSYILKLATGKIISVRYGSLLQRYTRRE